MLNATDMDTKKRGFRVTLKDTDIAALMQALLASDRRIQRLELESGAVWIKRQGTENSSWWISLQAFLAKLLPYSFLKPSPLLKPAAMMAREIRRMERFAEKGFPVAEIVYASDTAIALGDVGPTVEVMLKGLKNASPAENDALLVKATEALGALHAAGLCHGRPHVRDFFLRDGRIGFMDFEEEPEAVMPLESAQARDLWLLFLIVATRSVEQQKTCDEAFRLWRKQAPAATVQELQRLVTVLARFLPLARLIGRVRMGSDLRRFIMATDYLKNAVKPQAAGTYPGEAGKDD
jgi:tRNA A-37 threonylcarbamoyl transferase component Bud32